MIVKNQHINPFVDTYSLSIDKELQTRSQFNPQTSKIFYINIDSKTYRNQNAIREISNLSASLNVSFERISAVTPATYSQFSLQNSLKFPTLTDVLSDNKHQEKYHIRTNRDVYRFGSICCAMSHLKAIYRAKELGVKYAIMLEDDFVFYQDEYQDFLDSLEQVPNFDILYIAGLISFSPSKTMKKLGYVFSGSFENDAFFKLKSGYLGTGGWILNMENEQLVEELIQTIQQGIHFDRFLAFEVQSKYDCFIPKYRIGYQDFSDESTISTNAKTDSSRTRDMHTFSFCTPWNMNLSKHRRYIEIMKKC